MIPTAKEILFSRTFPGQNYYFPGQSIQYLKVINPEICKKDIVFTRCMINYWHFVVSLTPSSCFFLQVYYLFTDILFWVLFFECSIFSIRFPDFIKFKDISMTWKTNLLFSRFSRACVKGCSTFYFFYIRLYLFKTIKNIYFQPKCNYFVIGRHI